MCIHHTYEAIYHKELTHAIMQADKSLGLKLVGWRLREPTEQVESKSKGWRNQSADSIVLGQRPLRVRPRKSQGVSSSPKGEEKTLMSWPVKQSLSRVRLFATPWTVTWDCKSVHGISQARVPEWVAISFSKDSS